MLSYSDILVILSYGPLASLGFAQSCLNALAKGGV